MELTATRCNLDRSQCEQYDKLYIKKLCNMFEQEKGSVFGTSILKNIEPSLSCPLKQVTNSICKLV